MVSVARLLDGATPQRVHKMTLDGLLHFVANQHGLDLRYGLHHDEAPLRRVQRHIQFRLPNLSMRRELFALHLPNPERLKANLRNLALQTQSLSGGDILNICLNAIHAGSRDHDPATWLVTEKLLLREIRRTKVAKDRHGGKTGRERRIGFPA